MEKGKHRWGRQYPPGYRFGRLTIVSEVDGIYCGNQHKRHFLCRCDCGKEATVWITNLKNGHTQSCGCFVAERSHGRRTHGATQTRLHATWSGMLARCRNPHCKSYQYYGAKGTAVHPGWLRFEAFQEWALSNGYRDDLTIDRINPFGNYEPNNCRWIPRSEQWKTSRRQALKNAQLQVVCQ